MNMKLIPLLPVGKLTARTSVVETSTGRDETNDIIEELESELDELEEKSRARLDKILYTVVEEGKKSGLNLMPMERSIKSSWMTFWRSTRVLVYSEWKKLKK